MDKNIRLIRRLGKKNYRILRTSNFSDIESSPVGKKIIRKLVAEAGRAAASEAKAIGLPRVFARGNAIIREYSDGRNEVIARRQSSRGEGYFIRKKLGVLHARAK
jgi:hypothetical protein